MDKKDICGIYGYYDNLNECIVYVGQSQHIYERHRQHILPSYYKQQQINKVLQNNPSRYDLIILKECDATQLNHWEITLIALFNPRHNHAKGGIVGLDNSNEKHGMWKHTLKNELIKEFYLSGWNSTQMADFFGVSRRTIERRLRKMFDADFIRKTRNKRISKANKGNKLSEEHKEHLRKIKKGVKPSEETRRKLSESLKGRVVSEETRRKMSEANSVKYPRIVKAGYGTHGEQTYALKYLKNKRIRLSIYYYELWLLFIALEIQEGFIKT